MTLRNYTSAHYFESSLHVRTLPSFPTRRSSDLKQHVAAHRRPSQTNGNAGPPRALRHFDVGPEPWRAEKLLHALGCDLRAFRSEEHTSELQSRFDLVCRLLLEKKKHTQ